MALLVAVVDSMMVGPALDVDVLALSLHLWHHRKVQLLPPIQSHQAVVVATYPRLAAIVDEVVGVWLGKSHRTTIAQSSTVLTARVNLRKTCLSSAPSVHEVSLPSHLLCTAISDLNSFQDQV
jgi:hypothetical protein